MIDARTARTRPPAKLNLFLELLSRREDGFHEIDTVMVPIDWCDELSVQRTERPGIELDVDWLPSQRILADRLGISGDPDAVEAILGIPDTASNLVYQAIEKFQTRFHVPGGFRCQLRKQIPAGAGMGGASSDAAAALRCAAAICGLSRESDEIRKIASTIGSDVPFFLGPHIGPKGGQNSGTELRRTGRSFAAQATGRGEQIDVIDLANQLYFVVAYPCRSLSTAAVYAACSVPKSPISSAAILSVLRDGDPLRIGQNLYNRLAEPAKKIAPLIDEIYKSMWRSGLQACQLTGSGSACFAIATSASSARHGAARLRSRLQPGVLVKVVRSTNVPPEVFIH